jgi:hypothetical protein
MLSAASPPTLAKSARMGHPRSDMGKEEQGTEKGRPPASGATAWTANAPSWSVPDFQGGLVVPNLNANPQSIYKLDGITGQAYPAYTVNPPNGVAGSTLGQVLLVHTDGTIFTLQTNYDSNHNVTTVPVIGINPTTGTQVLSVPLSPQSTSTSTSTSTITEICIPFCYLFAPRPNSARPMDSSTTTTTTTSTSTTAPPAVTVGSAIIAGDGYAYIPYTYQNVTSVSTFVEVYGIGVPQSASATQTTDTVVHLMLMRVGTDGSSSQIDVQDFDSKYMNQSYSCTGANCSGGPNFNVAVVTGTLPTPYSFQAITNADQGVAFSWTAATPACPIVKGLVCTSEGASTSGFGTTSGGSVSSKSASAGVWPAPQASVSTSTPVWPVLQAQDGTFYGSDNNGDMINFSQSGAVSWSVPNDYPAIATANGGVIGYSGVTYDSQGRADGQLANMPTQSWTGNAYPQPQSTATQVAATPTDYTTSYAAIGGGNPTANGTYVKRIGDAYRAAIASTAYGDYIGGEIVSPTPAYPSLEQCNVFVGEVLGEAQASIPPIISGSTSWLETSPPEEWAIGSVLGARWVYIGAAQWYDPDFPDDAPQPSNNGLVQGQATHSAQCWTPVPGGPDAAQAGDMLAGQSNVEGKTFFHVGIVESQGNLVSAATWPKVLVPGTVVMNNYGWRTTGKYGLKSKSKVKRFTCF